MNPSNSDNKIDGSDKDRDCSCCENVESESDKEENSAGGAGIEFDNSGDSEVLPPLF